MKSVSRTEIVRPMDPLSRSPQVEGTRLQQSQEARYYLGTYLPRPTQVPTWPLAKIKVLTWVVLTQAPGTQIPNHVLLLLPPLSDFSECEALTYNLEFYEVTIGHKG